MNTPYARWYLLKRKRARLAKLAAPPATVFQTYNGQPKALMGFASQPSGGRWNMTGATENIDGAMLTYRIKGSDAWMYCFSGDSTPYRVLVDSENFTSYTTPALASGKIPLFTGLADTWHTVFVWADNSPTGQGFVAPTGNLIEAYGSSAQVLPMSATTYYLAQPDFPGVATGLRTTNVYYPAGYNQMIGRADQTGYGTVNASVHCRARFDSLWVFCHRITTHINISINGALPTIVSLSATDAGAQTTGTWRKINIPAQSSYVNIILAGVGTDTGSAANGYAMHGLMALGVNADILAPTGSRRHVTMMGASQVQGVNNATGGFKNDLAMVQNRLNIYGVSCGLAGSTITTLTAAVPNIATKVATKDIALLSVGINSADDGAFETDYIALIQACLTAGWTKVVARGLVQQAGSNTSKNAKIASAVASFASANVVYADVSTWGATTNGADGTIAMPDGAHPDAAGYATMADFWVRDHAALFA